MSFLDILEPIMRLLGTVFCLWWAWAIYTDKDPIDTKMNKGDKVIFTIFIGILGLSYLINLVTENVIPWLS